MAREMKDSGIEWIGKIPDNWIVQRGKNVLAILNRPVLEDDGVITCFRDGEVTLRSKRREEGFTFSLQEVGYQGIEPGDLVVHGMDGFAGAIGISDSRGKATPVLNVLDSSQNKRYLMYYLRCAAHCGLFLSLSTGIRVRSCDTNWNKLKIIMYLLPPLKEQDKIVDYLDSKCKHIDAVIEQTRISIEEYKKLKQAVITQAVTKGIRHDLPMKDSGIEWIGMIPVDWSVSPIKRILSEQTEKTPTGEGEQLSVNQKKGVVKAEESDAANPSLSTVDWKIVHKNDIVFNKYKAHSGVFFVSDLDGIVTFNYSVFRCVNGNCPKYYEYQFKTDGCIGEFKKQMRGVGESISPLYTRDLFKIFVAVPPIVIQQEIADYIGKKLKDIDGLIRKKEIFISEMEMIKKSLIYEYVTGKKEVPA